MQLTYNIIGLQFCRIRVDWLANEAKPKYLLAWELCRVLLVKVALSRAQCEIGDVFDSQVSIYICVGFLSVTNLNLALRY